MKTKKAPSINPALYAKVLKLATAGGSHSSLGIVLGTDDESTIKLYLDHMKTSDAPLFKKWGSKWTPDEPEADDDDIFGGGDGPVVVVEDEEPAPAPVKKPAKAKAAPEPPADEEDMFGGESHSDDSERNYSVQAESGNVDIDGRSYLPVFKLRKPDGTTVELEVFSKNPKWGFLLQHKVPKDMRTLTVAGREVEVDMLKLYADQDGLTELWPGKIVANSKLVALAELQEI